MSRSPIAPVTPLPCWREVAAADWRDPAWHVEHSLCDAAAAARALGLDAAAGRQIAAAHAEYPLRVTPYYLSLADPADPADPILAQCLPDPQELRAGGLDDPTDERSDSPAPGLVHRYPDRALLLLTGTCRTHCRHCNRKRLWRADAGPPAVAQRDAALAVLRERHGIREVILSGGDPLTLPGPTLADWLDALWSVETLEVVRIGSRLPVVLPMAVDEALCERLATRGPIWLNTHFNHPREVTAEAAAACERLRRAGVGLSNQSVLLRGVNDDAAVLAELNLELLRIGVRPYYLYHCDPARGVSHFRTTVERGLQILEALRGRISGLAQPHFAVDLPGGGGKVHLEPDCVVSREGPTLKLRALDGSVREYPDGDVNDGGGDSMGDSMKLGRFEE